MSKYLEDLVKLSKFDRDISMFEPQIENERAKLSTFVQTAEVIKTSIENEKEEIKEIQTKKSKNNIHLAELRDKLEDVAKKNKEISTEKELKALQLEEEIAKEQIEFANEEISRLEALLETKQSNLEELESKLEKEEEDIKEVQIAVDTAIEEINKKRSVISTQKGELLEKFDPKILTFYEKIKRWAKQTAVVPVRKQACYGCFMKINDKTYAEVIKAEEIVNCPHCGRILYKEIDEQEETKEA